MFVFFCFVFFLKENYTNAASDASKGKGYNQA